MANAHGLSDQAVKTVIRNWAEWTADELPAEEVDRDEFVAQEARKLAVRLERDFEREYFEMIVPFFTAIRRIESKLFDEDYFEQPDNVSYEDREHLIYIFEDHINVGVNNIFSSLTTGV